MNALGRDLTYMERVVIKAERMSPRYQEFKKRIFVVEGGLGMFADASKERSRIFGYLECDNRQIEICGDEIDNYQTNLLQVNGGES